MADTYSMTDLLDIMAKLRDPETGCPWDIEQTFETIAPYTIEEAYEVDDAIRAGNIPALVDELGDLLLQVVFHSQIGKDQGHFQFSDVINSVSRKMVDRHPHVFGDASVEDANAQIKAWEEQKAAERAKKAEDAGEALSALDGVTPGLPSLLRAIKLQNRAARVGFDWPETKQVLDKIQEESEELLVEVKKGTNQELVKEEFGDLLFVLANLGRHFKLDPEECLRAANAKFERRFRGVEQLLLDDGKSPQQATLEEMDTKWEEIKHRERQSC